MSALLVSKAACAKPTVCPDQAIYSPMPNDEAWRYSIGHWIESDPVNDDESFSSPGVSAPTPGSKRA